MFIPVIVVVMSASVVAALTDAFRFKVYNVLTLPLMVSGLIYHGVAGGWSGLSLSFLGLLVGFVLLLIPFLMGGIGAGDVKLLAGVGAWTGLPWILYIFIYAGLAAGIIGFGVSLWLKGSVSEVAIDVLTLWHRMTSLAGELKKAEWVEDKIVVPKNKRRVIPFAVMVAFGVFMTFVVSGDISVRWH